MPFLLDQLVQGSDRIVTVTPDTRVSEALTRMINHGFTQLPAVDENGKLIGIISEQDILRTQRLMPKVNILDDITVRQCFVEATTLRLDDDLFTALDRLEKANAVVVVDNDSKPVGIVTNYDASRFFRNLTEGLLVARDIEVVLRQYIERAFPSEQGMKAALVHAFGLSRKSGTTEPAKEYSRLTLGEHIQLIQADENWTVFEPVFQPKHVFSGILERARDIRNDIAHLRNQAGHSELDELRRAYQWLSRCPKLPVPSETNAHAIETKAEVGTPSGTLTESSSAKYGPLKRWLHNQDVSEESVNITFDEIEAMLREKLPAAATEHPSWWANARESNLVSDTWLSEGWYVEAVDCSFIGLVTFKRMPVPKEVWSEV